MSRLGLVGFGRHGMLARLCVIASAAASIALALPGTSQAASWRLQGAHTPSATNGALNGVSCPSSTACEAAGYSLNSTGHQVTLAEVWNGTSWAVQSTPTPTGATASFLEGISCASTTACIAVGGFSTFGSFPSQALAEGWNGTNWSIQTVPTPTSGSEVSLTGVWCTSASACIAVGSYYLSTVNHSVPLAAQWDGATWTVQTAPSPTGTTAAALYGVTCTSSTACVAVGGYTTAVGGSTPTHPLVDRWDGTSWTNQAAHTPTGATGAELSGVSCTAATACTAVGGWTKSGTFPNLTLAERWNGTSWTDQASPSPSGTSGFSSVSCPSATTCTAVGSPIGSTGVAESWNGTSWTTQKTPTPNGRLLVGVACTSTSACIAVGNQKPAFQQGLASALAEAWNGTSWSLQKAQNQSGASTSMFNGTSCGAATFCSAVGSFVATGGQQRLLAEGWNGTSWSIQSAPTPSGASSPTFNGVSCTSATACTAVGGTSLGTLAEGWNGSAWTAQATPNPASSSGSRFSAVSCTSTTSCMAVGVYQNNTGQRLPLAEQWNGSTWTIQTPANPTGATLATLGGVSCTASNACEAVGGYSTTSGAFSPNLVLLEAWNGTSWAIQSAAVPTSTTAAVFTGVSCSAASACTAVGGYATSGTSPNQTLADRWDGTSWTVQTTPNPSSFSRFSGDSCPTATACEAVGSFFAQGWNGTSWSSQTPATPATGSGALAGVSCTAATTCTAVGSINVTFLTAPIFANSIFVGSSSLPLAERYS